MNDFKKCESRGYHNLEFIEDDVYCNEFKITGYLQCKECGACTSQIYENLFMDGEEIGGKLAKEEEEDQQKEYRESVL